MYCQHHVLVHASIQGWRKKPPKTKQKLKNIHVLIVVIKLRNTNKSLY